MSSAFTFAIASAGCFLALAYAAVSTPRATFLRMTAFMAAMGALLALVSPVAGVALMAPVLFSRRLARSEQDGVAGSVSVQHRLGG